MSMNSFYSEKELESLGFSKIGKNVLISKKCSIYGAEKIVMGNNVRVDDFCILSGKIEMGDYIHIAAFSAIYGGSDGVIIDDYANISSRVSVYSVSDDYSGESMTNPMIPDKYKKVKSETVMIKKHVIIGSTSVIMPGVVLEEGCSFGAFSFITESTQPWGIYMGIPCKRKKERKKNLLELEKEFKENLSL